MTALSHPDSTLTSSGYFSLFRAVRIVSVVLSILFVPLLQAETQPGLIPTLVSKLNVSEPQARGGLGAILEMASANLSSSQFGQLASAIPGAKDLIKAAPPVEMPDPLKKDVQSNALFDLNNQFMKLGMDNSMPMKFAQTLVEYLKSSGNVKALQAFKDSFPLNLKLEGTSWMDIIN
ncbi:DUF2780 domain-containing protein [Parendozoicomonas haliclonae]|uniref:DUF2780 domain-containing protein n=1 Tax=Parendozoicomonas haliclonae TaxID=1960125 RepID=A0A1X7AKZ4_9GAMM|nr:DUF2780 domain-containing protein [Parendozoicomonas haliclonae]SMA47570.1 hypothetical protein EHSB41UT_02470 [Parendozoicomonas haliclonae]